MSSFWLINAQKLNHYLLFNYKKITFEYGKNCAGLAAGLDWFKDLIKDKNCISALLNKKETSYKYVDSLVQVNQLPKFFLISPLFYLVIKLLISVN